MKQKLTIEIDASHPQEDAYKSEITGLIERIRNDIAAEATQWVGSHPLYKNEASARVKITIN